MLISVSPARLLNPWIGFVYFIPDVSTYIPILVAEGFDSKFKNPDFARSNTVTPEGDVTVASVAFTDDGVAFVSTPVISTAFPFIVTVTGVAFGGTFIVTPPSTFSSVGEDSYTALNEPVFEAPGPSTPSADTTPLSV